jgi:hypothetical protein
MLKRRALPGQDCSSTAKLVPSAEEIKEKTSTDICFRDDGSNELIITLLSLML